MIRWEYLRTKEMHGEDLNARGAQGWELVAVVQPQNAANYPSCDLYWKRPAAPAVVALPTPPKA